MTRYRLGRQPATLVEDETEAPVTRRWHGGIAAHSLCSSSEQICPHGLSPAHADRNAVADDLRLLGEIAGTGSPTPADDRGTSASIASQLDQDHAVPSPALGRRDNPRPGSLGEHPLCPLAHCVIGSPRLTEAGRWSGGSFCVCDRKPPA